MSRESNSFTRTPPCLKIRQQQPCNFIISVTEVNGCTQRHRPSDRYNTASIVVSHTHDVTGLLGDLAMMTAPTLRWYSIVMENDQNRVESSGAGTSGKEPLDHSVGLHDEINWITAIVGFCSLSEGNYLGYMAMNESNHWHKACHTPVR